jgi:REP element-mobilizing transposase RayT
MEGMGRRLRFVPPGSLVEVTCRTVQGRCLLKPTPLCADVTRGVLARAARLYPVQVHAFCFLSNHFHLLLTVADAQRLAAFMNYLNGNLAREIGRQVGWREKFWGRRYQAIPVANEEGAQVDRLLYILRHGCKENLVRRPLDWPGATSTEALLTGSPVSGRWFDRTLAYRAARSGVLLKPLDLSQVETLELSPLPCWSRLDPIRCRARIAALVEGIESETELRIRATEREPLGRERVLRQDPHLRPNRPDKGPAPLVHAMSKEVRREWRERYRRFADAFRFASRRLRLDAVRPFEALLLFPPGSFPPACSPLVVIAPP